MLKKLPVVGNKKLRIKLKVNALLTVFLKQIGGKFSNSKDKNA
jgi:hypothetical protein